MNNATKKLVRDRAVERCEYCQLSQADSPLTMLQIEHICPKKHGGNDHPDNLALACIDCKLHKGPNLSGIDPLSNEVIPLFHPRRDHWDDHFEWSGNFILGKTEIGRATIAVLNMNSDEQLALRSS